MKKVTCRRCRHVGKTGKNYAFPTFFCKITRKRVNPYISEKTIECLHYKRRR